MNDSVQARTAVIDACLWLVREGLTFGTWGNISLRLDDDRMLITPSKVPYEEMKPEDLIVMGLNGDILSGSRLPTSERELHRGILASRPDIQAIIHTHSACAMGVSTLDGGIPPLSEEMCQLIGGAVPVTSRFVPSEQHKELGDEVVHTLGDKNALLIRNHGAICCGRSLDEAKVCCQVVEKSARIYLAVKGSGYHPVEEPWVTAGRNYYLYAYGKT